jgi:hypothetical protein
MSRSSRSVCRTRTHPTLRETATTTLKERLQGEWSLTTCDIQAPRASCATRATASCVSARHGASPRVSTTGCAGGSRATWLCHRYVGLLYELEPGHLRARGGNGQTGHRVLRVEFGPGFDEDNRRLTQATSDRLWLQQEDQAHDALRPQGLRRQQRQGRRAPPDAQQDLRRRVR